MNGHRQYRTLARREDIPTEVVWAFRDRLHRVGEHRLWQGAVDNAGTPALGLDYAKYSVLRIAWILHHGTAPDGIVRTGCGTRLCVLGQHLTDATTRQREQLVLASIRGIDMSGTCTAGHPHTEHGTVRNSGRVECRACDAQRRRDNRAADKAVA